MIADCLDAGSSKEKLDLGQRGRQYSSADGQNTDDDNEHIYIQESCFCERKGWGNMYKWYHFLIYLEMGGSKSIESDTWFSINLYNNMIAEKHNGDD